MPTPEELLARIEALEARALAAEDYRELVNLQGAYGYYVDKGLWDKAANLFADEGTLEIAGRGVYVGRARVREYLGRLPEYGDGTIYNHMQLQPVLHIDSAAGTAKGRWRTLMMVGFIGREGRWGEATYENSYVRERGKWRIASLHGIINFYCEYDEGWHRGGVPLLRSTEGVQPDRPPSFEYEAHPKAVIAPFHYDEV
ncbi:nuclear transport factor 2 family protein [Aurantiacibacter rhizosphaerae]|uniref:Nuclear transport factor 2 family protein n=1 Tax=Aurantiacibacter rhizosphaerae TaxID=2691582 RepID=A0A844X9W8_9SPHN|nr:nuclear transport factor 2 family protein [Aurantiacibacter rhizosphaerae]MWV26579.1 nuclear transport factor 2 family protein [Aurantiacibacter rhizosphaerae]